MNITLIGMPGVGKSTIGKMMADKMDYGYLDSDIIIQSRTGYRLQELIELKGEEFFLKVEQEAIISLSDIENTVICPGGSIVYSKPAMLFLRRISKLVFLELPLSELKRRVSDFENRGVVGLKKNSLEELYKERLLLYAEYADVRVKLDPAWRIEQNCDKIIKRVTDKVEDE